jgi:hypothetical protein
MCMRHGTMLDKMKRRGQKHGALSKNLASLHVLLDRRRHSTMFTGHIVLLASSSNGRDFCSTYGGCNRYEGITGLIFAVANQTNQRRNTQRERERERERERGSHGRKERRHNRVARPRALRGLFSGSARWTRAQQFQRT